MINYHDVTQKHRSKTPLYQKAMDHRCKLDQTVAKANITTTLKYDKEASIKQFKQ